jgi:hypothetical protein
VSDLARWTLDPTSQYMTILLLKMAYVENAINLGYNVLLADADIAWRGDALAPRCWPQARAADVDLLIQSDARRNVPEKSNWLCAGFFYLRANERTSLFMRTTRESHAGVWRAGPGRLATAAARHRAERALSRAPGSRPARPASPWLDAAQLGHERTPS